MAFSLQSPVFAAGQPIPQKYTCDGEKTSPPLTWTDLPDGTRSLALILEDPDAPNGTFTHWVAYNIDPAQGGLPEAVSDREPGMMTGKNSSGQYGYSPPCPPGGTHRYFFRLYALNNHLSLPAGEPREVLERSLQAHGIGQAELMGTYGRP